MESHSRVRLAGGEGWESCFEGNVMQRSGLLLLLAGLALAGLAAGAKQEEKMGGHKPGTYNHGIATHHRFDRGGHAEDHEELDEAEEMFDMRRRGPRARKRHGSQFEQGDTNRDGVLDVEEYKAIYRNPLERLQETDAKYKAIEASDRMKGGTFPKIDTDGNGVISRGEWDSLMKESEDKGEGPDPDMMEEHKIINGLQKRLRRDLNPALPVAFLSHHGRSGVGFSLYRHARQPYGGHNQTYFDITESWSSLGGPPRRSAPVPALLHVPVPDQICPPGRQGGPECL